MPRPVKPLGHRPLATPTLATLTLAVCASPLAAPVGLPVWSLLIGRGHVLPWLLLPLTLALDAQLAAALSSAAVLANLGLRMHLARRFRQHLAGVLLHPLSALLLAIQWWALLRYLAGRPNVWRGRAYGRTTGTRPAGAPAVD
jgi:hypothetical protein